MTANILPGPLQHVHDRSLLLKDLIVTVSREAFCSWDHCWDNVCCCFQDRTFWRATYYRNSLRSI